ncbi:MAG: TIGR00282 family metallophosphoesterase [Oscillospiraceae bacterium]|nr:TIGR00282 family metallophosphoesterase [Oscillospiraceae bacterium]
MNIRVLAVGDVVGECGMDFLRRKLPGLKKLYGVHFTVVNGENVACNGLTPQQADEIFSAGADVITMGNHTWDKQQIVDYMEDIPYLIRPANYTHRAPGRGWGVYDGPRGLRIRVVNLIGRCGMDANFENPFTTVDEVLRSEDADITLVDLHAEATSEKGAMAWYLDGRAQALWGTHTHVPTADCQVLPKGLGFVSDLGMTGPSQSVIGIKPEQAINRFLGGLPRRFTPADGPCQLNAVLFEIDTAQRRCVSAQRVDVT